MKAKVVTFKDCTLASLKKDRPKAKFIIFVFKNSSTFLKLFIIIAFSGYCFWRVNCFEA